MHLYTYFAMDIQLASSAARTWHIPAIVRASSILTSTRGSRRRMSQSGCIFRPFPPRAGYVQGPRGVIAHPDCSLTSGGTSPPGSSVSKEPGRRRTRCSRRLTGAAGHPTSNSLKKMAAEVRDEMGEDFDFRKCRRTTVGTSKGREHPQRPHQHGATRHFHHAA